MGTENPIERKIDDILAKSSKISTSAKIRGLKPLDSHWFLDARLVRVSTTITSCQFLHAIGMKGEKHKKTSLPMAKLSSLNRSMNQWSRKKTSYSTLKQSTTSNEEITSAQTITKKCIIANGKKLTMMYLRDDESVIKDFFQTFNNTCKPAYGNHPSFSYSSSIFRKIVGIK